jgi:alkylated DNA nucleotide flippase Atl1
MDSRFCAICNKVSAAGRPRGAIATTTLDEILQFLNDQHVRTTYGAVAELLGVPARSLGVRLGDRRPEASWIVNAQNGLPNGYSQHEMHAALPRSEIITFGTALAMRIAAWKAKRRR